MDKLLLKTWWIVKRSNSNRKQEKKKKLRALSCHCTSIQPEFQLVLTISSSLDLGNRALHGFNKQTNFLYISFELLIWLSKDTESKLRQKKNNDRKLFLIVIRFVAKVLTNCGFLASKYFSIEIDWWWKEVLLCDMPK